MAAMVLSGAAALIYETAWARSLEQFMGGTAQTVALILASFMGGMALGSWMGGRFADSWKRPLAAYGVLELALGLSGAVMPWVLGVVGRCYLAHAGLFPEGVISLAVRELLFLLLLSVPAVLMGATFPMACRAAVFSSGGLGSKISLIYAANSAGAVIGCLLCGLWLIPGLGLARSSLVGSTLNLAAASIALLFVPWIAERKTGPVGSECASADAPEGSGPAPLASVNEPGGPSSIDSTAHDDLPSALPFHLVVSGFTAMAYEVAYTRLLPLVIGASTYSFTLMLAAFIAGISRGAAALARLSDLPARRVLARCQLRLGITVLITLPLLSVWPFLYVFVKCGLHPPFPVFLLIVFLLAFPIMSYPAYHLGMVIPAAAAVFSSNVKSMGRGIGRAYLANTVGNVVGSLACGWIFLPGLGLHRTFVLMALLNICSGLGLSRFLPGPIPLRFRVGIVVAALLCLLFPRFHPSLTAGGAFRIASGVREGFAMVWTQGAYSILMEKEDANTSVLVQETRNTTPTVRFLKVAGKVDASDSNDMHTQLLLAHLPLGLASGTRRVLVIGLGCGATVGAALTHGVERVDVAEISSGVAEASRLFAHVNGRYWMDPRVHLSVDDARHFLATRSEPYDVIISEPSNPWMAGIVNLYTREFFSCAADRMQQDGLFCQWIHTYEMSRPVLAMITRTFCEVFPHTRVFLTGSGADVLVVGSRRPILPSERQVADRWGKTAVAESLERIRIRHPVTPMVLEVFDARQTHAFGQDEPPVTDDRPLIEFLAPRALYANDRVSLPLAENLRSRGHLWRLWRPDGALSEQEQSEVVRYVDGILADFPQRLRQIRAGQDN